MYIFNISDPLILMLMVMATALLIFLAQEIKKSYITGGILVAYLLIIVVHVAQLITLPAEYGHLVNTLTRCIVVDLIFIFISFFAYLWVDDLEAKKLGKKSLSNSLNWFWKKV